MTPMSLNETDEELADRAVAELIGLEGSMFAMPLDALTTMHLITVLQLGLSHPLLDPKMHQKVERVAKALAHGLAPDPDSAVAQVLRMGWDASDAAKERKKEYSCTVT